MNVMKNINILFQRFTLYFEEIYATQQTKTS